MAPKLRITANRVGNNLLKPTSTRSALCKVGPWVQPHKHQSTVTSILLVHREIRINILSPCLQPTYDILRRGKPIVMEKLDGSLRVVAPSAQNNQGRLFTRGWCCSCFLQQGFECGQLLFQHGEWDVQRRRNRSDLEVVRGAYVQ